MQQSLSLSTRDLHFNIPTMATNFGQERQALSTSANEDEFPSRRPQQLADYSCTQTEAADQEAVDGGVRNMEDDQVPQVKKPYDFFDLPGNIRNQIYGYVLGGADWVLYSRSKFKAKNGIKKPLALLETCRQIYCETAILPFKLNAFALRGGIVNSKTAVPRPGRLHIHGLRPKKNPPDGCRFVKKLLLEDWPQTWGRDEEETASSLLGQFSAVESIHINSHGGQPTDEMKWFKDHGRFILKVLRLQPAVDSWILTIAMVERTFTMDEQKWADFDRVVQTWNWKTEQMFRIRASFANTVRARLRQRIDDEDSDNELSGAFT
ncbi:unnamed protein product [Periconia digitata]|uniref:Uncharacterized protein n=1 Tax=Periconia digitata TaxID=1303443 RepID=A0A9W4XET9_9PLEO|nr:unnamed protein product [Periconia digitata]